ncbi:LGFP repeat-containing protein, partial [Mycobacteroides immunogenum]
SFRTYELPVRPDHSATRDIAHPTRPTFMAIEPKKDLGAPYDNQKETLDRTGIYQQFDGGVLIYRNGEPVYFVWGKIRDAWNDNQASQGKLGYPTADETTETDGSFKSTFEHGTITFKPGDADAKVSLTH